jgi:hypothetical protein
MPAKGIHLSKSFSNIAETGVSAEDIDSVKIKTDTSSTSKPLVMRKKSS